MKAMGVIIRERLQCSWAFGAWQFHVDHAKPFDLLGPTERSFLCPPHHPAFFCVSVTPFVVSAC